MKQTPWGKADDAVTLADGIISYSTPSHGGIWLSKARQAELNYSHNFLNNPAWWEEDCDWAVPYVFFAEAIRRNGTAYEFEKNLEAAKKTVAQCHPGFQTWAGKK